MAGTREIDPVIATSLLLRLSLGLVEGGGGDHGVGESHPGPSNVESARPKAPKPTRAATAIGTLWLAVLGAFFLRVLVANWSDNAYLDELEWRFNGRDNPWLFRDTLLKLIGSQNLSYRSLVGTGQSQKG